MTTLIDKTKDQATHDICAQFDGRPDALLEILHTVQQSEGYLRDDALRAVADALNISRAEIHGVVSFYHDFHKEPPARHVLRLCRAEACQAVGSEVLAAHAEEKLSIKTGEKTTDNKIGLEAVYCLGNCALGPAAMIDGKLQARMTPATFDAAVAKLEGVG